MSCSYTSQAARTDVHPCVLWDIDPGMLSSLAAHLGSSTTELSARLQTEAQVQSSTGTAWRIDNPSRETEKNPSD